MATSSEPFREDARDVLQTILGFLSIRPLGQSPASALSVNRLNLPADIRRDDRPLVFSFVTLLPQRANNGLIDAFRTGSYGVTGFYDSSNIADRWIFIPNVLC